MRFLSSPLARRLMATLLLLTLVPVVVFAGFVQRTVTSALFELAQHDVHAQARILAASIPPGFEANLTGRLLEGSAGMGTQPAVISREGRYLAHPNPQRVASSALDDFLGQTIDGFFAAPSGVVLELASGRLIGYAELPGRDAVAIVAADRSAFEGPLSVLRLAALVQMTVALVVVLAVGVVVIGRVIEPVQSMIDVAERIGAGELDLEITSRGMDGELRVLAETIEQMAARLRESYAALERQVHERGEALETINAVADLLSRSPELDQVLGATIDGLLEALQVQSAVLFVREGADGQLRVAEQRGVDAAMAELVREAPLARRAVAELAPVVVDDARHEPALPPSLRETDFRSVAAIPLVAQGRAVGALTVACHSPGRFPPESVDLLVTVGNQIGVAVESARLYGQARQLAALEERQRLARDLHDAVSQSLYGISLYAEAASRLLGTDEPERAAESIDQLRATAADAVREMRLLIFELRPPILQQSGLAGALRTRLEAVERRSGLETAFEVEGYEPQPAAVEEAFYRIAQEALNNALKHAQASRVELRLTQGRHRLCLEVLDDGVGLDLARVDSGGIGLSSMRERAEAIGARFLAEPRTQGGTRVAVILPAS